MVKWWLKALCRDWKADWLQGGVCVGQLAICMSSDEAICHLHHSVMMSKPNDAVSWANEVASQFHVSSDKLDDATDLFVKQLSVSSMTITRSCMRC